MAPRALWKGFLKLGELACPVALHSAASTSERITFHTLNRKTGNRLRRQFVDQETGEPVESEDQVKGYESAKDKYVILEPEEIAAAVPESDKTLDVEAFLSCSAVDTLYIDKPYWLTPTDRAGHAVFAVIRDGLRGKKAVAVARAVLFRRVRSVLIRAYDEGLAAATLHFDYEVRSPGQAFGEIRDITIGKEMLDLARHIISTKKGAFDPAEFDDRYDNALAELVRAKQEGRPIKAPARKREEKVVDLMEALRQSAGQKPAAKKAPARRKAEAPKRKAG